MYPTDSEGSLASSRHRGFFVCNAMVDVCLSASVGMLFYQHNSSCMSYFGALCYFIIAYVICCSTPIISEHLYNIYKTNIRVLSLITRVSVRA